MPGKLIAFEDDIPWPSTEWEDFARIAPQAPPTCERIKSLLSRGLIEPEGLTPEEVREMSASLVFHLLSQRFGTRGLV